LRIIDRALIDRTGATRVAAEPVDEDVGAAILVPGKAANGIFVPQAAKVVLPIIDRALIDRTGATRLDDTIDLAGGVSRQNDFGGL
jgi:hypothetical protein